MAVILGIDPGIATVGFGAIKTENNKHTLIRCGAITTPAKTRLSTRLEQIHSDMLQLIDLFKPEELAFSQKVIQNHQGF